MQTIDEQIQEHLELQRQYGGEYVVHCGREVLAHAADGNQIADWLDRNRPLPEGAVIEWMPPTDVLVVY